MTLPGDEKKTPIHASLEDILRDVKIGQIDASLRTRRYIAICPYCGHASSTRSGDAIDATIRDHLEAVHPSPAVRIRHA